MSKCPTCGSPYPNRHPAMQFEGEVEICTDDFHLADTPEARPYHSLVLAKRRRIEDEQGYIEWQEDHYHD